MVLGMTAAASVFFVTAMGPFDTSAHRKIVSQTRLSEAAFEDGTVPCRLDRLHMSFFRAAHQAGCGVLWLLEHATALGVEAPHIDSADACGSECAGSPEQRATSMREGRPRARPIGAAPELHPVMDDLSQKHVRLTLPVVLRDMDPWSGSITTTSITSP
jgi:hypothetical protein